MISGTTVTQEFTENSSYCFELILPRMQKSSFKQLLFVYLVSNILLPSTEHCVGLASIISHEVISDLSVSLCSAFSVMLLKSCFLL